MSTPSRAVNWSSYAQTYDMLLAYNPFYQQLHQEVLDHTTRWNIEPGDLLMDVGAGTGNYSCTLAETFPQAQVLHIDRDEGMNAVARQKQIQGGLHNLRIVTKAVDQLRFQPNSVKACICIHALYTLRDPRTLLSHMHDWLVPGGQGIFVDPGRILKVADWQWAIGWRMLRQHGFIQTWRVMRAGKEISHQNRLISQYQADGTYWTHTTEEFLQAIASVGFEIVEHGTTFRKVSDWAIVRKSI